MVRRSQPADQDQRRGRDRGGVAAGHPGRRGTPWSLAGSRTPTGQAVVRRNAEEIAKMRRAGKVVAEMHEATRASAKPGVTTAELNAVAADVIERRGARSNFLHYRGFPAVICTSPNDMIVHGIPGPYVLEEGDILSIDCGAIIEGYHGDAAFTMGIGQVTAEATRLMEVTEASLWAGIDQL